MITGRQLQDLAEVSAEIGRNPLLVQGPGGNTSIKDVDELWVKASGAWLAEAMERPVFVPLDRRALVDEAGRAKLEIGPQAVIEARNEARLRPSIETALHALMPHPVVVHAHAVNAMAVSVLAEGAALAADRLAGLAWRWIAYSQPGAGLAEAVRDALANAPADVLLLQNHGVVVGADTPTGAQALLERVEALLALPVRSVSEPIVSAIDLFADDVFEVHGAASALALDADAVALLTGHVLVPDQVVFLGGAVPKVEPGARPRDVADALHATTGVTPALLLLPGIGALAAQNRSAAADCLIDGLVEIARRVPRGSKIHGLRVDQVAALLGWEAEHYRRALDAERVRVR
jgi:rhamnose utilization protein RhaD (predicted bifunctional aldolase and dehydrogenase)